MGRVVLWIVGGAAILLSASLGALVLSAWISRQGTRARLGRLACPRCGKLIGTEGAHAAAQEDFRRKEALVREAAVQELEIRLSPEWRFACPSCGAPLVFDPQAGTVIVGPSVPL